jgi:hypothetical protein
MVNKNKERFLESIRLTADRLNEQNNVAEEESSLTTLWSPQDNFLLNSVSFFFKVTMTYFSRKSEHSTAEGIQGPELKKFNLSSHLGVTYPTQYC